MPIERDYREAWRVIGQHSGHDVWSSGDEAEVIHGTIVGVHFESCIGCVKCITACPTNVFSLYSESSGHEVVDPLKESDCILCLACELVCPADAVHIQRSGGSDETLDSLLG